MLNMKTKLYTICIISTLFVMIFCFSVIPRVIADPSDWHGGAPVTHANYTITYEEEYGNSVNFGDYAKYKMWVNFLDTTKARVGFEIIYWMYPGGLNSGMTGVDDWTKIKYVEPTITGQVYDSSGKQVTGRQALKGYGVYNGTHKDFTVVNQTSGDDWWLGCGNSEMAQILFNNSTVYVNEPIVSVVGDTIYVDFDVDINATAGTRTSNGTLPALLNVQFRHNSTHTIYKYGIDIDFQGATEFPTEFVVANESDYFLVAQDLLEVFHDSNTIKDYNATTDNATAIYKSSAGVELCRLNVPKVFNITAKNDRFGGDILNNATKRFFYHRGRYEYNQLGSNIFIVHDGFKYNVSDGFNFDPTFIMPNSAAPIYSGDDEDDDDDDNDNKAAIPGPSVEILMIVMSFIIIALVTTVRKREIKR